MTEQSPHGLGWRPDLPDIRDWQLPARLRVASLASSVDLSPNCSPVRDQGQLGSCTGHAIAAAIEYLRRIDDDHRSTIYSPLWIYYEERVLENSVESDAGAYIRDGIKVVNKIGAPPESRWPYIETKFTKRPNKSSYRDAERWRLGAYYRCNTLTEVLMALASGKPVVGGFSVYHSMFTDAVNKSGIIPMPDTRDILLGGHAVCFIGYDLAARLVHFKNSWGEGWGRKGYGSLPFTYLEHPDLSADFWCLSGEL